MEGYRDLSAQYDVRPGRGRHHSLGFGTGRQCNGHRAYRRQPYQTAQRRTPGDLIAVGGSLGESGAGLRDILAGRYDTPLAQIHRNPPRKSPKASGSANVRKCTP